MAKTTNNTGSIGNINPAKDNPNIYKSAQLLFGARYLLKEPFLIEKLFNKKVFDLFMLHIELESQALVQLSIKEKGDEVALARNFLYSATISIQLHDIQGAQASIDQALGLASKLNNDEIKCAAQEVAFLVSELGGPGLTASCDFMQD